jgi:hypothetical protein
MARDKHEDFSDTCKENSAGVHSPDWGSVTIAYDGGETYIDVNCEHCGQSGCVGTHVTLAEGITW